MFRHNVVSKDEQINHTKKKTSNPPDIHQDIISAFCSFRNQITAKSMAVHQDRQFLAGMAAARGLDFHGVHLTSLTHPIQPRVLFFLPAPKVRALELKRPQEGVWQGTNPPD